ncbi:MAG: hypothetical protein QF731_09485 [Verrucomicrobiota bacterium]|nr:hypothetical protein [Verrucomicrobiota bacterium]
MSWELIFTRNIGWKALSILSAIAIWYTINGRQQTNDPKRVKEATMVEAKPSAPLETPESTTNRVNVIQNFALRILQTPNDTSRYIIDPEEVKVELASDADPAPDLTSPTAVKVFLDPFELPEGVNETNLNVRVSFGSMKDIIVKKYTPLEVKVTRIKKEPTPVVPTQTEPKTEVPIESKKED